MPQFELKNLPLGGVSGIAGNGAGRWLTSAPDGSVALTDDLVTYVSGAGPGFVSSSGELCADASRWYMVNYGSFAWSTDGFVGATWATSSLTTLYPGGGGGLGAPRSAQSVGPVIALPAARRPDAPPYGFAVDASGLLRPVAVSVAGAVATLAPLAGAVSYQLLWYPLLTVRCPAGPRVSYDAAGAVASWELVCEEA